MAYEDVIQEMGEFGRYQKRIFLILCIPAISCGIHKMSGVFLAAKPDFRCSLPYENPDNATYKLPEIVANASYPWDRNIQSWSQCEIYETPLDGNFSSEDATIINCDSFVYDKTQYELTATTEWNLVCENSWLRTTSNAIFMMGELLGSVIFGGLSDRFGRKVIFVSALLIQLISGILVAVSPNFIFYLIVRLILGLTSSGAFLVLYVMAYEMVGPKKRLAMGTACQILVSLGSIIIAGLAYFITNWRILEIAFAIPSFTFVVYRWLIPESARWLLSKGQVEEAKKILKNAASENGVELSENSLNTLAKTDSKTDSCIEQPSAFDLVRYPNLRRKSLVLFVVWLVNSGTYYGLSWNTSNLLGNDYINYGVTIAAEVPGYLFVYFTLDKWGRKAILCGCMLLAGTLLLLTLIVPADMPWLIVLFAILGKWAITSSYGAVYVFTTEQYPTGIRNIGLGVCSTCARLGGVLAPYVSLLADVWIHFPLAVLGSCALITGLLSLILPETLNKKLPESIKEGEQFGKKSNKDDQDIEKSKDSKMVYPPMAPETELHV